MSNCIGPINIIPDNNQIVLLDNNKSITVVDNNCCTDVNVTQPITSVVQILTGPIGPVGSSGSAGPSGSVGPSGSAGSSAPFSYVSGTTWNTTSSIEITGSFTVSGSNTFRNIGPAQFTGSVDILGTLIVTNGITGSLLGTASFAQTASYVLQAVSSSFATTASYYGGSVISASYASNSTSASYAVSSSQTQNAISASYALTASYVANASSFPFTGSAVITGSLIITGSTTSTLGFTGSLLGTATTASYVLQAVSASYATTAQTASYITLAQTASYVITAQTASYVLNAVSSSYASTSTSASYAVTSSYSTYATTAGNGGVTKILAGANVNLSPVNGLGDVTVTSFGTNLYNTATGSYGSFYDTGSVTATSATAVYSMSLSTTDISNGVFVSASNGDNTRVKFTNAGTYNVQFSSQFSNTDNSIQDVVIWVKKNGVDVVDSSGVVGVPSFKAGSNGQAIGSWNYYLSLSANDFIQLCWHVEQANVITLETIAAGTSPTHPRTPSTILTATRVDTFLSNTGSFSGSFTGTLIGTASYAVTASHVVTTQFVPYIGGISNVNLGTHDLQLNGIVTANYYNNVAITDPLGTATLTISDGKTLTVPNNATVSGTNTGDQNLSGLATLASPTFTGTVVLPSTTSIGNVSNTEIGYLDGVTSAIQTQIDSKSEKSILLFSSALNPADSSDYYFSIGYIAATTSPNQKRFKFDTGSTTAIKLALQMSNTSAASNELVTLNLRNQTTTTDYLIGTFDMSLVAANTNWLFEFAFSHTINTTDQWTIKMTTPAWATNPTSTIMQFKLYYK